MTEEKSRIETAEITTSTLKNLVVYLAAYAVPAILLTITIGPLSVVPGLSGWLSFLYLPGIVAILLLFISSAAGLVLAGRMAGPISRSLLILAMTCFVATATFTQGALPGLSSLALPLFFTGAAFALTVVAASVSDQAKTLFLTILTIAAGILTLVTPAAMGLPDGVPVGWMLFAGFIVAALALLLRLLQGHSSEYLAVIGDYFSRPEIPWVIGALCTLLLGYNQYLRPILVAAMPLGISALEWGVVLIVLISAGFRTLGFVRSVSQARKPGDLQSLVQRIAYDRSSIESAHAAVERFVEGGKKEGLIIYVTTVMLENKTPPEVIEGVLAELVGYSDKPEPAVAFKWATGDVAEKNRAGRLALAGKLVSTVSAAIGQSSITEEPIAVNVRDHSGGM
ncbi:hypothetical protein [Methanocella sp. MCL-LM]|uniref:hypothetical protein n=1 Tax=Methanocella sp. MCL-LM TaxID=3412035 RepID=UPI003C713495